ncbi:hypothetical protein ASG11_04590 [Sphingomonas sp. Leaf357]|uniref:NAD(P)-dependent oxidoreductase n=1 Tax=Sphingomonas sp. Leaf357 TaxID=1736350 RepID=UPI0006F8C719|nr:NAD(P)-dependent oxidoreductase [Sphingomonas sp. Leaf357]KQS03615.1 hypothetical protein ASG11_04590 [Sphingomonas sp. Leaf357]
MKVAVMRQDPRLNRLVVDTLEKEGVPARLFDGRADMLAKDDAKLAAIQVLFAPGTMVVDDALLARLPGLSGIVSPYIGIEGFDRAAATARGIVIGNGQIPESVESMAEGTVLMLLAAAYQLPAATAAMADGAWPTPLARGRLLRAMTVGIVGYGRIAQEVAIRLVPFGCRMLVHAPRLRAPLPQCAEAVALPDLLAVSDAVVLLASLGPDSRHLINADMIARIKPGAIVVNTARGGLIDEDALVAAAQAGRLGWLALDVFEQEPLPPDAPIRALPDAILTPHAIGHSVDTMQRLPLHALDSIRRVLRGDPPLSLVNPDAVPAWRARCAKPSARI